MITHLKKIAASIIFLGLTSIAFASSSFNPYADITINAHWDSQYQDMEPMDLVTIGQKNGIKSFHLAFITDAAQCAPAWGSQESYSVKKKWGSHLTDKLREKNIHYWVALGGANGKDLSNKEACKSQEDLQKVYEEIIKIYQPEGLDFDIENGTADVKKIMAVLPAIQKTHPKLKMSFTLPTMPEGLTAEGKNIIEQAKAVNLHFTVNIMAMDYGPAYVNDMGEYAILVVYIFFSGLINIPFLKA